MKHILVHVLITGDSSAVVLAVVAAVLVLGLVGLVAKRRRPGTSVPGRRTTSTPSQADTVHARVGDGAPRVLVVNGSGQPVHDVRAFVALGPRRRPTFAGWIRTLEPTGAEGARLALTADGREAWIKWLGDGHGDSSQVEVEFTFRDGAGQYWHRTRGGELVAIDEDDASLHLGRRRLRLSA